MKASGKEIIQAIVEDMYEGREELRYSVLPPGIYRIYLHEKDYKRLAPIVKHIVEEAVRALNEEIDRMNGQYASGGGLLIDARNSLLKLRRKAESVIQRTFSDRAWKKPAEGWQISINVDPNDELEPGDLCVNSELRLPQRIELGEGNPTRNITTIRRMGSTSRSERKYSEEPVPYAGGAASEQTSDGPKTGHARIRYWDGNAQEKIFEMDKSSVVVGRGGPQSIVNLALEEGTKISREHFVLRRDDRTGKFYIRDISKFGTRVNGIALTKSPATGETETTGTGLEMELPKRATIELAGSLKIEFEVVGDAQPNGKL